MTLKSKHLATSLVLLVGGVGLIAQSTLGTLTGTVRDTSGATIPGATITARRTGTGTTRTATSSPDGTYSILNLEAGTYSITLSAPSFGSQTFESVVLTARQQLRLDATLTAADVAASVSVDASNAGAITTDNASIAASLSSQDVLNLPANYRGAGSTSPLSVIQTLPGVQPDSGSYPPTPSASPNPSIKFSIQGGLPSQSETTVDGISAQNQTSNNIQADAFPSAESIAEIRVDGVNNNAEYGQPGEITTTTKAGTNHLHGSAFWYFQNQGFDAIPYGAATKPHKVANDFGASAGGPVVLPRLYNGKDRTFFFATYEGLRYPQSRPIQYLVPTARMKRGDFSQETNALRNPFAPGTTYANKTLPTLNPSATAFLSLFPDPNVGDPALSVQNALATQGYNYVVNKRNNISSNQYDARVDQRFGQRAFFFARYTNKNINQSQPTDLALPNSDAYAHYRIFATSLNYIFTPKLANEFRFGFTLEEDGIANPFDGIALTNNAGFNGISRTFPFNGISHLGFEQLSGLGSRFNSSERSRIFQYVDNLTWEHAGHTVRFGADIRKLNAFTPLSFTPSDNFGNFYFHRTSSYTGEEFADFLLGAPYLTQLDTITSDNNGIAMAYALYGEDNWKATPNLNITFGLRWEFHPAFHSTTGNIGNFDPSIPGTGRLLYPTGAANLLSPQELANVNACATPGVTNPYATNGMVNGVGCTPVLSNAQAGLPSGLRHAPLLRFMPRLGFAYRPFGNDRTAIRGGAGYYNITTSGAIFYALSGTLQSNLQSFYNTATTPSFVFPNVSSAATNGFTGPSYGSSVFYSAVDVNWHDPYSLQTNLSIDRDLGRGFGLRVSYIGLHTWHLVWQPELNMLPYSNTTIAAQQPRTAFPFPNFASIYDRATAAQSNYNSGQAEVSHRFAHGFSFDSAYTFAKSLADNQGTYGAASGNSSFVDEQGGYDATYSYDRYIDYGNVVGTRRHRWLTSGVFELPVGRGRQFGARMNRLEDLALGGWQVSSIFLLQSGPFLTASLPSGGADPSGTGSGSLFYRQQRPDRIANGNATRHSRAQWFNPAAFTCPGSQGFQSLQNGSCVVGGYDANGNAVAPIGRFGTESIGDLVGPGNVVLSAGLAKSVTIADGVRLRAEGTFTNVLNHTNLNDPNLDATSPAFGQVTSARGSDFGGNRTGQVSLKLEF